MKAKILMIIISFIFLFIAYSNYIYAVTNENIGKFETTSNEENVEIDNSYNDLEMKNIIEDNNKEEIIEIDSIEENVITTGIPNEVIEESISIPYQGQICIDTPVFDQSFVRPDTMQIKVKGWAVSNDAKATVKILIDEKEVLNSVERTAERKDIDSIISPQYGGACNTPNAGFSGIINISELEAGKHKLRAEEISGYGEIITSHEIIINIINKKYQGQMYIDSPTYNQKFIRADAMQIKVKGWAVSNDVKATVKILIDGKEVLNNVTRTTERRDIDKSISPQYGGVSNTPNAGFSGIINISELGAGKHKLRVEEISRYGEKIISHEIMINIVNKKYQGQMYIDSPTYNQNFIRSDSMQIKVKGWAVSNDAKATVKILIDGKEVLNKATRTTERRDIDKSISPQYGGVSNTPNAGFSGIINISELGAGKHKLRVEEISRYGEKITSYEIMINIVNKKYQGQMYIDSPTYNQNFVRPDAMQIKVKGWAVSNDAKATVKILINGKEVLAKATRTTERRDIDRVISPQYGGISNTPNAGFSGVIDISNIGAGRHNLRVEEISRYGEKITSHEIMINIVNKKYKGEMCIDTPTYNQMYNSGASIAIGGWAVSQDEFATVEIYIDNVLKAKADRYNRSDVISYINKYNGKTMHAGFGKLINSSGLSAGIHKVTVYQKSRYGDIIGGAQTQFVIKSVSNNISNNNIQINSSNTNNINTLGTKGIDVSQFQGTINWKNVANSGVKFAMIRIGYRGYGTGGFAEDTKFKTNFSNAVASGLKVGVYYYSTAVNTAEAQKDAEYVISILRKYGYQNKVTMPIAIDLELISGVNTRDKNVSKSMRTSIANTFCSTIENYGYKSMIYACTSFLNYNMNTSQIPYDIWVAQYNSKCTYNGKYTMWQYSSSGKVSGINGNVDCNLCYKNY